MTYDKYEGSTPYYVLLIHGHGLNRTYLRPLAKKLADEGISHLTLDLPGYGFARDIDCKTYDEIVDYILGILDTEKIGDVVSAGYSYGGFISLALHARLKDRVKGLVLMASSYEIGLRTLNLNFVWRYYPLYTIINEACWLKYKEGKMDYDFSEVAQKDSDLQMVRHSSIATTRKNMLKNAGIMTQRSLRPEVEAVTAPTLIIQPTRCQFFSKRSYDFLHKTIPNAQRLQINMLHNIAPAWDTIFPAIRDFLASAGCS